MDKTREIIECAEKIKSFCAEHVYNEEECPFFRGYKDAPRKDGEPQVQLIICALNQWCSPCNWEV